MRDPLLEAADRISDADALICLTKSRACGGDKLALELLAAQARSLHHLLSVVVRLRTHPDYTIRPLLTDQDKRAKAVLWEIAERANRFGDSVVIGDSFGTCVGGQWRWTAINENQVPTNQSWLRAQLHHYERRAKE